MKAINYQGRLYNVLEDPSEQFNLSIEYPRIVERLQRRIDEMKASRRRPTSTKVHPDQETMEQLRALGYLQ